MIECQSAKAVAASSKDMPCFLRFSAAFLGSHSNFTPQCTVSCGWRAVPSAGGPPDHVGSQQSANADDGVSRTGAASATRVMSWDELNGVSVPREILHLRQTREVYRNRLRASR